ncbi:MAG: trypsin-like peptidase domain-containing protein [Clostridiales Family XIII bacterium]|jgi:S1-C subfamily serine protease|nr:trypsin-like peptidase domain-containing protein [Clostridiales Family XIII bacterium]
MGKTIIVFEDGRVVDTIEETKWEGVKIENGRLVADVPEPSQNLENATAAKPEELPLMPANTNETPVYADAAAEPSPGVQPDAQPDISQPAFAEEPGAQTDVSQPAFAARPDAQPVASYAEEPDARFSEEAAAAGTERIAGVGTAESRSTPYAAAAAQYPWRGEAAFEDMGKKPGRRGSGVDAKKVIAVILGLVLAAGAGFGGGIAAVNTGNALYLPPFQQITISPTDQVSTTEAVAAKVTPSVVGITSLTTRTVNAFPFGSYEDSRGGVGTGIIVDENGYILTNSHVVMDGEVDTITVLLPDGRDVRGDVLWNERSLDLAIVKVEATNLTAAELGDSDAIRLGSYVAAIGNPMGLDFRGSISQGVVSGLDRTIMTVSGDDVRYSGDNTVEMDGLIQVDAAINVGNSGGPLINSLGQVIGVNTARNQNGEGMGFAIPINTAKPIVDSVKTTGEFHRVYIGITPVNVTEYLAAFPQSDIGVESGAYVYRLSPDSPAEAAGIVEGDVIIEIDNKQIDTSSQLIKSLLGYKTGEVVKVKIVRDKRQMTLDVTLTDSVEQ